MPGGNYRYTELLLKERYRWVDGQGALLPQLRGFCPFVCCWGGQMFLKLCLEVGSISMNARLELDPAVPWLFCAIPALQAPEGVQARRILLVGTPRTSALTWLKSVQFNF